MRAVAIFARHGTEKYPDAALRLRELFDEQLPCIEFDILIVDNSLPPSRIYVTSANATTIGSSNDYWEFSGWDAGISHLGDKIGEYQVIALVTSAFLQFDPQHLKSVSSKMIRFLSGRTFALGHLDCFNESVMLYDHKYQSWLRSSFLIVSPNIVQKIGSFVSVHDRTSFFSSDPSSPFKPDAPLSESYKNFVVGWLTADGTGQGVEWHSRFELNESTLAFFQSKALAIFNEQMLSHRLRSLDCEIFDIVWLSRRLADGGFLGSPPGWKMQIAGRSS